MRRYIQKNIINNISIQKRSLLSIRSMFPACAEIQVLTQRPLSSFPVLIREHPPPVLHPIHHPFPMVGSLSHTHMRFSLYYFNPPDAYFTLLPTPSPELLHPSAHPHAHHPSSVHDIYLQNQPLPAWEAMRSEPSISIGSKRSHDYNVDDFFTDVKKRRVNPSYDPRE